MGHGELSGDSIYPEVFAGMMNLHYLHGEKAISVDLQSNSVHGFVLRDVVE